MKTKKIIFTILILMTAMFLAVTTISFADYSPSKFDSEIDPNAKGASNVKDIGGEIVGFIQVIGTIASVGMLIVLGIKYMMGSAEERAEYKKSMFPYLIGAVLIFAASNLTQIIYDWATKI